MAAATLLAIPTARDATGRTWRPSDIMSTPPGFSTSGLSCGGCPTPVTAVHDYRNRAATIVPAHFALPGGQRKIKSAHSATCPYNVAAAVEDLRRTLTVVTIGATGRERYELVLPPTGTLATDLGTPAARPAGTQPRHTSPTWATAVRPKLLNDLAKIAALVHRYRSDPAATALFTLRWGDQRMSWDDFYYPPDRHPALVARACTARPRKFGPVVVTAQITSIGADGVTDSGTPFKRVRLGLAATVGDPVLVRLQHTKPYADLAPGHALLILGDWTYRKLHEETGGSAMVSLWGNETAFIHIDPDVLDAHTPDS